LENKCYAQAASTFIFRFTVLPLGDRVPDGQSACGSALHIPARANSLQPLSKGSNGYGPFDQIAGEMYVTCILRGEVTYKPTLQAQ
jgi:hypothetical protein